MPRSNNKPQSPAARASARALTRSARPAEGRLRVHAESDWKFPRRARQRVYSTQLEVGLHSALLGSKATKAKTPCQKDWKGVRQTMRAVPSGYTATFSVSQMTALSEPQSS